LGVAENCNRCYREHVAKVRVRVKVRGSVMFKIRLSMRLRVRDRIVKGRVTVIVRMYDADEIENWKSENYDCWD
jgi:hypothetical protein